MPAIGNIVLADATSPTPVNHTFAPSSTDGARAKFANRSATTPRGFETLVIEVVPPNGSQGAHRVRASMGDPTEVTSNGVTVVDHINSCELTLNFSQSSTEQERKDLVKMLANLLNDSTFVNVASKIEPIY